MPSVPERPLSYGEILERRRVVAREARIKSEGIRRKHADKRKVKKTKFKYRDKRIFKDTLEQTRHLRSIVREEF